MKNIELLAPAGDWEALEAAAAFGADAVYVGGELLQLRAAKAAFDREKLKNAAEYLHNRGKRLYVTVNCFAENGEIEPAREYARFLYSIGVDAVIISDLGVLRAFGEAAPELERHVSTQANCMNYLTAQTYWDMGAKRVVLARELSLEAIAELRAKAPAGLELEAFVHGAMCMAYSGRCIISSCLTGRSGNRGECAQPCRWSYRLEEEKRPGEYFPVEEYENGTAILSSHDLCCIDFLDKIADAGVCSFKIEGRMKTAYYVATAVNAYRRAMDGKDSAENCRAELECLKHRPYASGFYFGELKTGHYNDGHYSQTCTFVGRALDSGDGCVTVEQRNHFKPGDRLEVLSPGEDIRSFTVTRLWDETGTELDCARHPRQKVRVECPFRVAPGAFIRRRDN